MMIAAGQATVAGVVPAKVAILTEGVIKAMLLSKLKTATVGLLLAALFTGAAGAIYQLQAGEQPKGGQKSNATAGVPAPQEILSSPPDASHFLKYAVSAKVVEVGADKAEKELFTPRMILDPKESRTFFHLDTMPDNLLAKVVHDEKIKVGLIFDCRVERLDENKVRLFWSFQQNELEKCSLNEIRVMGRNVQAIEDVELRKPVKVVIEKDAEGSPRRWIETTVDDNGATPVKAPPGPTFRFGETPQKGSGK